MSSLTNLSGRLDSFQAKRSRSIGAILIEADRLTVADAERIAACQATEGIRFGEAGVHLGILDKADIRFALARQYEYPFLDAGDTAIDHRVEAAFQPFSPRVEALRALRGQLLLRWLEEERERRALTLLSPGSGDGRSWLAANLAVVFSQLGERTLLIDADLRSPSQHRLFGRGNATGLAELLSGRAASSDVIQRVPELDTLTLICAGAPPPNPQEMLSRAEFGELLRQVRGSFDIVLIDTSPTGLFLDGHIVARRAGSAMLVAHKDNTPVRSVDDLYVALRDTGVHVVGSVLVDH